jgi:tetratricopeptide (TPR) repeat protein
MPGTSWLHLIRADCQVRSGDYDRARADYERARILDPVDAWGYVWWYRNLMPVCSTVEHFPGQVVQLVKLLVDEEVGPGHERMLHPEAIVAIDMSVCFTATWGYGWLVPFGDNRAYLGRVEDLVAEGYLGPLDAARWAAEGCLMESRPDLAEVHARKAVALAPDDRRALGFLAEALVDLGRDVEAVATAEKGLARHRSDGRLCLVRGTAAFRRGDYRAAAPDLERAAKQSLFSHRYELWARCLARLDDPGAWERGIGAIRSGLALDNFDAYTFAHASRPFARDPRLERTFGELRTRQGNHAAAALHYARAFNFAQQPKAVEAFGADKSDALRAAKALAELDVLDAAWQYLQIARQDPRVRAEADALDARLRRR